MIKESRKVTVRVKFDKMLLGRLGENVSASDVLYNKNRIGSFLEGRGPARPLTFEEEKLYLPSIIGVSPNDPQWQETIKLYWANISIDIPFDYINGVDQGGKELETGFFYDTEEKAKIGRAEESAEFTKYQSERNQGRFYKMKFNKRFENGRPIELNDYIIYRHCLIHHIVANTPDEMNLSPRIRFFMESDTQKLAVATENHVFNLKVMTNYIELLGDRDKVTAVLDVIKHKAEDLKNRKNRTYDLSSNIGADIFLGDFKDVYPSEFLSVVNDKQLKAKAFIHRAIDAGLLRRLPNTGVIMYEDALLGNSLDETCDYIKLDTNKRVVQELKARLDALK